MNGYPLEPQFGSVNKKYINIYTNSSEAKIGDATKETSGWHGSGAHFWGFSQDYSRLVRAYSGSIFSYSSQGNAIDNMVAYYQKQYASRAVVVIGSGL